MPDLLILGDLAPIGKNLPVFLDGDLGLLFSDTLPVLQSHNSIAANLEGVLTDHTTPFRKVGGHVRAPKASVKALRAAGIDVLFLGNNHIADFGRAGLEETLQACSSSGIATVGAGLDSTQASTAVRKDIEGVSVSFLAAQEYFFPTAGMDTPGAWTPQFVELASRVGQEKQHSDVVIVSYHTGAEFYRFPSPGQQQECRYLVKQGADLVVCQHSHLAGGSEKYDNGFIVYGQGDFLFDVPHMVTSDRLTSVMLSVTFGKAGIENIEPVFARQNPANQPGVALISGDDLDFEKRGWQERSEIIINPVELRGRWDEYCAKQETRMLNALFSGSFGKMYSLFRRFRFDKFWMNKRRARILDHLISNSTNREILESILRKYN